MFFTGQHTGPGGVLTRSRNTLPAVRSVRVAGERYARREIKILGKTQYVDGGVPLNEPLTR